MTAAALERILVVFTFLAVFFVYWLSPIRVETTTSIDSQGVVSSTTTITVNYEEEETSTPTPTPTPTP